MRNNIRAEKRVFAYVATRPTGRVSFSDGNSVSNGNAGVSPIGAERRAGRNLPSRPVRPINLERRARFARIETA